MSDTTATVTSRDGAITVRTTEQGLPLALTIDPARLRGNPAELAAEILRLCRRSADRAALRRRAELVAAGARREMLTMMGLPEPDDVARREMVEEAEYETEPRSWLRPL